ncbi:MAG: chitobiase/beta-hexosaminidase C-terminal domain-containing protein [Anaerovoracaceae bacterium]|jgi:hypothetical protein
MTSRKTAKFFLVGRWPALLLAALLFFACCPDPAGAAQLRPAPPTFSLPGRTYDHAKLVTLRAGRNDRIYYTTNGRTPTAHARRYRHRLRIRRSTTVKAVCIRGHRRSRVRTVKYRIRRHSSRDLREDAHGISWIPLDSDSGCLIWSDQYGRKSTHGSWSHDVHAQRISLHDPVIHPSEQLTLAAAGEAQEPASASISGDGRIMVTFEDGWNNGSRELSQRYAVFSRSLQPVTPYQPRRTGGTTVLRGGHSGHTASTEDRHVIFWSEGWVDGGGVDNLGTGRRVGLTTYDSDGRKLCSRSVARGKGRYWWPLAAASDRSVLLLWQKYVGGQEYARLMTAVYDPQSDRFLSKPKVLDRRLQLLYYTYSAVYLPQCRRFLVLASRYDEKANLYLLDESGRLLARRSGLTGLQRECTPAVRAGDGICEAAYPNLRRGVSFVRVSSNIITSCGSLNGRCSWSYRGTAGFADDSGRACFATLTRDTVKLLRYRWLSR